MAYVQEYGGIINALITDAYIFGTEETQKSTVSPRHFLTHDAAWDTGAEVTIISPRVVAALGLQPFEHTTLMGIGGDENVDVYRIHIGLPNGYLYRNLIVYCSDIDDYDVLIGMDLIAESDFFLTCVDGHNRFSFDIPATGKAY